MVRVAGSGCADSDFLAFRRARPQTGNDHGRASVPSFNDLWLDILYRRAGDFDSAEIRSTRPPATTPKPASALHALDDHRWRLSRGIRFEEPGLAVVGFVRASLRRDVSCSTKFVPCQRPRRMALGQAQEPLGASIYLD